jgi:hypothetical protein
MLEGSQESSFETRSEHLSEGSRLTPICRRAEVDPRPSRVGGEEDRRAAAHAKLDGHLGRGGLEDAADARADVRPEIGYDRGQHDAVERRGGAHPA